MALTATIAEHAALNRLQAAARAGVPPQDLAFAERTDIDPEDVQALRRATRRLHLLLVLRCPKRGAMGFHGVFGAKRMADGRDRHGRPVKSGEAGLGVHPDTGRIFVSDYDMMCLYQRQGGRWRKVFASALQMGAERGPWSVEGMRLVRWLNQGLRSPLQHGAQDDYAPPAGKRHPNVQPDTRFAAFAEGAAEYLPDAASCKAYYQRQGLRWPYDAAGLFMGVQG